MSRVAPVTTFFDASTASRVISPNTITVLGIVIGNTTTGVIDVDFVDNLTDLNEYLAVTIPANDTVIVDIAFIADSGFAWVKDGAASADVHISVFHSQDAA